MDNLNPALFPNATSTDADQMADYWVMVEALVKGTEAMRKLGQRFLPKFTTEDRDDYEYRRKNAVYTNIYGDILNGLAAKPFAETCAIDPDAPDPYPALAEDIDGRGNSLHVFSQETFFWGINNSVHWILVDYPKTLKTGLRSVADEKKAGFRPYWVTITAPRVLAVYSDHINGVEMITHFRFAETVRERNQWTESIVSRVRVFDRAPIYGTDPNGETTNRVIGYAPPEYQLWEQRTHTGSATASTQWIMVESGPISIGVIPVVPFITGKRLESTWQFVPVMRDCAFAQVEHFQQETNLKSIKELTAFPMLSGDSVNPPADDKPIRVGPRTVLFGTVTGQTGRGGTWKYVEPQGESLKFLASEIERLEAQMRELGRQPLTVNSGNLTVVTTQFAAQKGNSAVQAWALNLQDSLEQAWAITAMWLGRNDPPTVRVFTDFGLDADDDLGVQTLSAMRSGGDLTQRTYWEEMQRRNILSDSFDAETETAELDKEKAQSLADQEAQLTLQQKFAPPPTTPGSDTKPAAASGKSTSKQPPTKGGSTSKPAKGSSSNG